MKRGLSTRTAIAFDIDGVFKYGREWSPDGLAALQKVSAAGMPFVFVTNGGGGLTEATYGTHLKDKVVAAGDASTASGGDLAVPEAKRMVLSYTPWESQLCPNLQDRKVLLVGDPKEKVLEVAAAYGLKKAIHYSDYAVQNPSVNPFRAAMESGTSHTAVANATKAPLGKKTQSQMTLAEAAEREAEDPFAAVLVMCDPYLWYEAIQVSVDVLCSPTPLKLEYDPQASPPRLELEPYWNRGRAVRPAPSMASRSFGCSLTGPTGSAGPSQGQANISRWENHLGPSPQSHSLTPAAPPAAGGADAIPLLQPRLPLQVRAPLPALRAGRIQDCIAGPL